MSSTAVLGDAEMQELEQLRRQNVGGKCGNAGAGGVLLIVREHPREAFIVLTLLVGAFMYFHFQNLSIDD